MNIIRNGCLIVAFLIFSSSSVYASSLEIKVRSTTVGNLLFRVRTLDNEKVPDETRFDLYEIDRTEKLSNDLEDYELVESAFSENSTIFFDNIPFGEYFVRASDENDYVGYKRVFINEDTVDTQHIAKSLLVDIDTENVPDNGSGSLDDTSSEGRPSNGESSSSDSNADTSEILKNDFNSKGNAEQEEIEQSSDEVSTGDKSLYALYVFVALASSLLGIVLYRRRDAGE